MKQRSGFTLTFDLKKTWFKVISHPVPTCSFLGFFVKSEPDWDKERSNTIWNKIYRSL